MSRLLVITVLLFVVASEAKAQVVESLSDTNLCCLDSRNDLINAPTIGTLSTFFGIDGSKQPHDFGVNANLGVNTSIAWGSAIVPNIGLGYQIGTRVSFSANAVQVLELIGEPKDRFQNFTTVGFFQRLPSGFAWGGVYDFQTLESYDNFTLGQMRFRASLEVSPQTEIGATLNIADRRDIGRLNSGVVVELEAVQQLSVFATHRWQSGVNTTFWIGIADEHSEENILTGMLPVRENQILFGADIFAPLNDYLAIYGETNLIMPSDTGAVDAFLGIEFTPGGSRNSRSRRNRFRPYFPVASSTTFTNNLTRR